MSRLRFVAYFVALSACATVAFASCFMDRAASAKSLEFAAYLESPLPRSAFLPKPLPHRNALREAQIAFVN